MICYVCKKELDKDKFGYSIGYVKVAIPSMKSMYLCQYCGDHQVVIYDPPRNEKAFRVVGAVFRGAEKMRQTDENL